MPWRFLGPGVPDNPIPSSIEAWEREIQDRIRVVDGGGVTGIPWEQVLQEAEKRLAI